VIDHVGLNVSDWGKSKRFYDAAMGALGAKLLMMVPMEHTGGKHVGGYGWRRPVFWLAESSDTGPGRHYAFQTEGRAEVDAFHAAAIAAGGRDNGAPGIRAHYHPDYYGAFVLDPDGNNIEAICHRPE
jgi:catechol 2,3-dioxygenase-like lactoylglutathione lyase family enzyme